MPPFQLLGQPEKIAPHRANAPNAEPTKAMRPLISEIIKGRMASVTKKATLVRTNVAFEWLGKGKEWN